MPKDPFEFGNLDQGQYDILEAIERRVAAGQDPLTEIERALDHGVKVVQTQHAILKYAEPMAQFLAAAAFASEKAVGDPADHALRNWLDVIHNRALELLSEARKAGREGRRAGFLQLDQRSGSEEKD